MSYLNIHYISKKLKHQYKGLTTVLIDSEVEDFCADILYSTLNNKREKIEHPLTVGIQQELIIQCFLYLLATNYKDQLNIHDVHFYIDNVQIQFDYKVPWQAWLNWSDLPKRYTEGYYSRFGFGIALAD
jgi:hypothetical protein